MKIYVVNCGKYDCCGIELVTDKVELAVKLISERIHSDDVFDCFNCMECWENGKILYKYCTELTLEHDILEEIKNMESNLVKGE